jgi:homocysteine S-methyltransferase
MQSIDLERVVEHPFLQRLARAPLMADGAMGTELYGRGVRSDQCLDALNLTHPEVVQQIHRSYIAAGSELIETNTFGANRYRLDPFGQADHARAINLAGAAIAREARDIMGEQVFVAGAIGPSGARFQPLGTMSFDEVGDAFREQAEALAERGVDVLILETFTILEEIVAAIRAAKQVCDLPIIAQMSFDDHRRTASGHDVAQVWKALEHLGVAVVGVNCGIGPQQAEELVSQFSALASAAISAQPNAGYPLRVGGRVAYGASPDYFASFARSAVASGAALVGGCCGTTPSHVQAMRDVLRQQAPATVKFTPVPRVPEPVATPHEVEPRSHLAAKLERREFVVSVEVDPPKGSNPIKALKGAELLRDAGADLINIGDSPMAKVRMSGLGLAILIQQQVGLETLVHLTSRDRNLMALQSDLLGMHAVGIRNVIALTGDQLRPSTNPPVTAVWDVDSIGLIGILRRLNQGIDYAGTSIGRPTRFVIACAVSPNHHDLDQELERFQRKLDAGADLIMTQPLFSMDQLLRFLDRVGELPVPLMLGVVPLESYRQAELLHHEVPGFSIPDDVRERMRKAGDHGSDEGRVIAEELIEQARPLVGGIYVITSYGRYDVAASLVRQVVGARPDEAAS